MQAHAVICGSGSRQKNISKMAAESSEFIALEKQIEVCLETFEALELGSYLDCLTIPKCLTMPSSHLQIP